MRVTRGKQYGLRYNCEKNGCVEKNGKECLGNGRIVTLNDLGVKFWNEGEWELGAIHGHACDRMTQVIIYEPWKLEED